MMKLNVGTGRDLSVRKSDTNNIQTDNPRVIPTSVRANSVSSVGTGRDLSVQKPDEMDNRIEMDKSRFVPTSDRTDILEQAENIDVERIMIKTDRSRPVPTSGCTDTIERAEDIDIGGIMIKTDKSRLVPTEVRAKTTVKACESECDYAQRKPNRLRNYDYSAGNWYFVTICVENRVPYFGKINHHRMELSDCGEMVNRQWKWLDDHYSYIRLEQFMIMPNHFHGILIIDPLLALSNVNPRTILGAGVGTGRDLSVRKSDTNNIQTDNPRVIPTSVRANSVSSVGTGRDLSVQKPDEMDNRIAMDKSRFVPTSDRTDILEQAENIDVERVMIKTDRSRPVPTSDRVDTVTTVEYANTTQKKQKIKSLSEIVGVFKTTSSKLIHRAGIQAFKWQRSFYDHVIRNEKSLYEIQQYIQNNPMQWEMDRYYADSKY